MKAFKNKCYSEYQNDSSFDFERDEENLDDDILSEGNTARTVHTLSNLEKNMRNTSFMTNKGNRTKMLKWDISQSDSYGMLRSQAIEGDGDLLQNSIKIDSPYLSVKNLDESKSNDSNVKIRTACQSPTTLKSEISQLLRWLAKKRNASSFKVDKKDQKRIDEQVKEINQEEQENIDSPISSSNPNSRLLFNPLVNGIQSERNIISKNRWEFPDDVTMCNVLPSLDMEAIFN